MTEIQKHYNSEGECVSESWDSTCPYCEGRMHHYRLTDGTGGYDYCYDCGYENDW